MFVIPLQFGKKIRLQNTAEYSILQLVLTSDNFELTKANMVEIVGRYTFEKNENIDEYFKAVGVPYIPRKLMCSSSPQLDITVDESGEWTFTTTTLLRTVVIKFILGQEYEEHMPGGVTIKSTTSRQADTFRTVSVLPNGSKVYRTYDFSATHCVLTMLHEESGVEAKRFYKRA